MTGGYQMKGARVERECRNDLDTVTGFWWWNQDSDCKDRFTQ